MVDFNEYRDELTELFKQLCAIPAPTDHEDERIAFIANWYADNGLLNFEIDSMGNVLYFFGLKSYNPIHLYTAHVDTVFSENTALNPKIEDGVLYCPGSGDNTANLAIMMMTVKLLSDIGYEPPCGLIFAADIGEEGLGNLKGIKAIFGEYGVRIEQVVALDLAYGTVIDRAVGSKRFSIRVETKGGHALNDFGTPNAIAVSASIIKDLYRQILPSEGRTTYNVGTISGGTAVNVIASSVEFCYEFRFDNKSSGEYMEKKLNEIISENESSEVSIKSELIGERPCMGNPDETKQQFLMDKTVHCLRNPEWTKAGYKDEIHFISGSTDCNIPLSKNIPAICMGLAYSEGHHTLNEYTRLDSLVPGLASLYTFICE